MTLPSNSSFEDAINKLSELEGINQKSELSSVIGSPTLPQDTVAQQIVKLQQLKNLFAENLTDKGVDTNNDEDLEVMIENVGSIPTGGNIATGTAVGSSTTATFQYYNGTSAPNHNFIEYSGLNFEPDFIIYSYQPSATAFFTHVYIKGDATYTARVIMTQGNATRSDSYNYNIKANAASCYVNSTGFKLPVLVPNAGGLNISFTAIGN